MLLMLPLTMPVASFASEQSRWVQYSHAASRMYGKKNYQRAADLYEAAERSAEDEHRRPEEVANTLLNLSDCLIETRSFRAAWTTILRARTIIQTQHLADDPIAVRLMRRESLYYQRQGMYAEAVACQKEVVEKVRTIFGDSTALASEYIILQIVQADYAGQHADAAQTGMTALALMKKVKLDPNCDKWLWVFNRTGGSMLAIGQTKQAVAMWLDSVRMSIPLKSLAHGGSALGKLVDIAARDPDAKDQGALIAELCPLADKLCAIDETDEKLQKIRQRLKSMQAASSPVAPPVH
jgi:tetratricopeptide (TPR) repeat protein